jgi:osmotically inducible protein OsmC
LLFDPVPVAQERSRAIVTPGRERRLTVQPRRNRMDRSATAIWKGNLKEGAGTLETQSGALKSLPYSFKGRFEDESGKSGTNPEELIAAAHAGCFAMQFSHFLAENGTPAAKLDAKAVVTLVPGTGITQSALTVVGTVPGIDAAKFKELADKAKAGCPVSKALGAINVTLNASLG